MYAILRYQANGSSVMLRPKIKAKNLQHVKYPFAFMFVGDSFFVPYAVMPKHTHSLYNAGIRAGKKISLEATNTGYHVHCVGYCTPHSAPSEKPKKRKLVHSDKDRRQSVVRYLTARLAA
jgi:hypothetical protein